MTDKIDAMAGLLRTAQNVVSAYYDEHCKPAALGEFMYLLKLATDRAATVAKDGGVPVATVIKKGADRQWMSEALGSLPDGLYSLYLAPQPEASVALNPWREAVLDQCAIAHLPFYEDDPKKTIDNIIDWHVQVSHDPAVSDRAATQQAEEVRAFEFSHKGESIAFDGHDEWTLPLTYKRLAPVAMELARRLAASISEDTQQAGGVAALVEENRQLTAKLNEWRDKHTESEESRMELLRLLNEETSGSTFMGEPVLPPRANVAELVNRFLGWPLPKTFAPDCGISFDGRKDDEWNKSKTWPTGTNLFNAVEAKAMFEHCLSAPISEDTGKPTAENAGGLSEYDALLVASQELAGQLAVEKALNVRLTRESAAPSASIGELSDLRAWLSRLEDEAPNDTGPQLFTKVRSYLQGWGYLTARTVNEVSNTPASVGSIGEDAEFLRRLNAVTYKRHAAGLSRSDSALIAHIDRWASSRASQMEAAPRNAGVVEALRVLKMAQNWQGARRDKGNAVEWDLLQGAIDGLKSVATAEPDWLECERISNVPAVDEAIRGLLEDPTGDNATSMVREILKAAQLTKE